MLIPQIAEENFALTYASYKVYLIDRVWGWVSAEIIRARESARYIATCLLRFSRLPRPIFRCRFAYESLPARQR
jgi:hypothetical protein